MLPIVPESALVVNISRGPAVESRHFVHAVVMDGQGGPMAVHGDADRLTFPRSTLKPLQALALIESGAADAYSLTREEIALACASHSGEDIHMNAVSAWLQRLGLDEEHLECGPQPPRHGAKSAATRLCNNCSGKHAGMLTLALHLKAPTRGYTATDHPVQQAILARMGDMCGTALTPALCGTDGCSAPNPLMPLRALARGFATLMTKDNAAYSRILAAMGAHPDLVAGTGRLDTVLMTAAKGKIISKTGAEGVYIALVPEKNIVIALKAEDGAKRAAQAALHTLLARHKLADDAVLAAIAPLTLPRIKNWDGLETGRTSCD